MESSRDCICLLPSPLVPRLTGSVDAGLVLALAGEFELVLEAPQQLSSSFYQTIVASAPLGQFNR